MRAVGDEEIIMIGYRFFAFFACIFGSTAALGYLILRTMCTAPGVVVAGVDPDLLVTLYFLSFSVNINRTEVKFYGTRVIRKVTEEIISRNTLFFIPRRTVFLSCSSISLSLIFFTASMSWGSATYLRFVDGADESDALN